MSFIDLSSDVGDRLAKAQAPRVPRSESQGSADPIGLVRQKQYLFRDVYPPTPDLLKKKKEYEARTRQQKGE
ncbi:MAG: hypothetical protein FJW26_16325 [Acidimicrobiia bacterium]|nr:hypothetical protein [Acidimicrobiia bacterium]